MRDGNMLKYVIESFATRDGTRFPDFPEDCKRYPKRYWIVRNERRMMNDK